MSLKRTELQRKTGLKRSPSKLKRSPLGHATDAQREKVRDRACVACGKQPCDPAHLIARAVAPLAADDVRAVVPLCREDHYLFDLGDLDLSPFLEPYWRDEIAFAVQSVGLFSALRRITGRRWFPVDGAA